MNHAKSIALALTISACIFVSAICIGASDAEILSNIYYTIDAADGLTVSQLNGTIILEGAAATLDDRDNAEGIAKIYSPNVLNYITVSSAEQVRLEVMVLEVDRAKVGDLGIIWGTAGSAGFIPGTFYIGQGIANAANPLNLNMPGQIGYANIQAKVKALIRDGYTKILSNPALITCNNSAAFIRVGGSLPVPKGVGQNYAIDWKDYGIKLTVTPRIMSGDNYINTDVAIEIIDIDALSLQNSVTISDGTQSATIPIFKKNTANANLSLKVGETMALGGLLSYELNTDTEGLIGLSDIPIMGGLFKNTSKKHTATDLVVLVTPTIVYSNVDPKIKGTESAQLIVDKSLYQNRFDITDK